MPSAPGTWRREFIALEKALGAFYQLGLELRPLLRRADLFDTSKAIQDHLGRAYVDLMEIVTSVAIHFHQLVHGLNTTHATASVDVYTTFGDQIQTLRSASDNAHTNCGHAVSSAKRSLAKMRSMLFNDG